jgi:hypothetical protein
MTIMKRGTLPIFIGDMPQKQANKRVCGDYVSCLGETFYRIQNFDAIEPFFMSIVSSSDHWLFIASTGGLSAGRQNAENALFPYYTVDKLTENSDNTGHKAVLIVTRSGRTSLWEPFSNQHQGSYHIQRHLYKNVSGTALIFEEVNDDLGLSYRYAWRTGERFGFIKTAWLKNLAQTPCQVELLDGLQNILPANVATTTQNVFSCLLDAYKRNELEPNSGLGIFTLSSTLSDLAEPSESLLATTIAHVGLPNPQFLLSSAQLNHFRMGQTLSFETDVRGQRGAYFAHAILDLAADEERSWHFLADVNQDSAAVVEKVQWFQGDREALLAAIQDDIAANQASLEQIVARADGVQVSNSLLDTAYHFANVMFNVMRGGVFVDHYEVQTAAFIQFVALRNQHVLHAHRDFLAALPKQMTIFDLQAHIEAHSSPDLLRLSYAYLPLTFSRRHGDPSRPWNRFAINVKAADGSVKLGYEGNWRDIFQNWEALAYSYPEFVESMIATFLNATTVDGYNPYRITHQGVDWEVPEPDNPWANIGYWSDHQIIYLQKLLEISVQVHPRKLHSLLDRPLFSYAHVPYRIKPYADLLRDPYNSIDFDWSLEDQIKARQHELGTDARMVIGADGQVLQVSLAEKLMTLLLAKLVNFVPEGGLWMNTQRPEWNDANNALVGKGLSVVTLCYLRRYVAFLRDFFAQSTLDSVPLNREVEDCYTRTAAILSHFEGLLPNALNDEQRRAIMDALGEVGSSYRWGFYENGLSGLVTHTPVAEIIGFLDLVQRWIEHSLRANQRPDGLFHSYNILRLTDGRASVAPLYEMLEGQVAILSSGMLSAEEALTLLHSLRSSALYEPQQQSYLLYPNRELSGFLQKNLLTPAQVASLQLVDQLVAAGDTTLITRDILGHYHFNGRIHNLRDVRRILHELKKDARYATLIEAEADQIEALFEATFRHDEFTGRSGTFFAYEGLGSIYWHMVAKLMLAVQEVALSFKDTPSFESLQKCYIEIRQGLGFHKTPDQYGAFPTDPYSHTPKGQGAKQPGMTGMVKEAILCRQAEMGFYVREGKITFDTTLLNADEFLTSPTTLSYTDVLGQRQQMVLPAGSVAYFICQTPTLIQRSDRACITIHYSDGTSQTVEGHTLDTETSRKVFRREGSVHSLIVSVPVDMRRSL